MELPVFSSDRERSLWLQAQLRLKGTSLAGLAREHGVSRTTLFNVMFMPNDRAEKALASALGVSQQELFPERFDVTGKRLHHVRQSTAPAVTNNVKSSEAA